MRQGAGNTTDVHAQLARMEDGYVAVNTALEGTGTLKKSVSGAIVPERHKVPGCYFPCDFLGTREIVGNFL